MSTLPKTSLFLSVFIKIKTTLNYHICSDLNGCMTMSWRWQGALTFRLAPSHYLQIKDIKIVKVLFAICSSKNKNFSLCNEYSWVSISCWRRANTLWTLEPCHCDWIKSMKIPKNFSFGSSTTKNNNFRSCKHSRMSITWSGWSTWDFWFSKFVSINIKNVCIIKIGITFCFSSKIMTTKNNYWSSWKSGRMPSSGTRTYTFNNGISPLPSSDLKLSIRELTWRLLRIWAFTFFSAFAT